MVGGVGEVGEKTWKEEEDDFALEGDIKGDRDRLDRCREADGRQWGLEEDSAIEGGSRGEVG